MKEARQKKEMDVKAVARKAIESLEAIVNLKPSGVISVSLLQDNGWQGWQVLVELIERKAIPETQDVLGIYRVRLDREGVLQGYDRIRVRRRSDTES